MYRGSGPGRAKIAGCGGEHIWTFVPGNGAQAAGNCESTPAMRPGDFDGYGVHPCAARCAGGRGRRNLNEDPAAEVTILGCVLIRPPRWRSESAFADTQCLLVRSQARSRERPLELPDDRLAQFRRVEHDDVRAERRRGSPRTSPGRSSRSRRGPSRDSRRLG